MSVSTAFAVYFILWWLSLFVVLPWGVRSQHESGEVSPGTEPGAPMLPRIAAKLMWTTVVASGAFGLRNVVNLNRVVRLAGRDRLLGF
jgi:predicted secreted protein